MFWRLHQRSMEDPCADCSCSHSCSSDGPRLLSRPSRALHIRPRVCICAPGRPLLPRSWRPFRAALSCGGVDVRTAGAPSPTRQEPATSLSATWAGTRLTRRLLHRAVDTRTQMEFASPHLGARPTEGRRPVRRHSVATGPTASASTAAVRARIMVECPAGFRRMVAQLVR
jgi:hypothetical protein